MTDIVERLRNHSASMGFGGCQDCYDTVMEDAEKLNRLRSVLASLLKDPPSTLDEPDTDYEVIQKMRTIIREALA